MKVEREIEMAMDRERCTTRQKLTLATSTTNRVEEGLRGNETAQVRALGKILALTPLPSATGRTVRRTPVGMEVTAEARRSQRHAHTPTLGLRAQTQRTSTTTSFVSCVKCRSYQDAGISTNQVSDTSRFSFRRNRT